MNNNSFLSPVSVAVVVSAATATVGLILRAMKRSFSPTVHAKLSCRCGKIQGEICAKKDDSVRLHCYCEDCRNYAQTIANLDDTTNENNPPITYPCGESRIVQVCKNAVSIHQGTEYIRLARKSKVQNGGGTGMFRYYAGCCYVPLMNTYDFLGFVGVLEDNLDPREREKFYGPFKYCTKEAVKFPLEHNVPDMFGLVFVWNVLRYIPWTKAGPFDYSMTPTIFWGNDQSKKQT